MAPVEPAEKNASALPAFDGAAGKHDRRFTLGHHGANGIVIHGDNVGCLKSLNTCMGSSKGIDDFSGASCQDLDIGIGGKRGLIPSRTT